MIKTVIFDIGNVLVRFAWKPYITELFDEEKADHITEALWHDGYWNEFDRGILTDEQIREKMVVYAPKYEKEIHYALDHAGKCLHKFDYAIPWIQELKEKGYQVLFLSNYSEFLMKANPEVLDFLPCMDGGVFSCDVKLIKPDSVIYAKICEKYNLNPDECMFIDDYAANIEAANAFGIHGFLFEGYENSYPIIMGYLNNNK